MRTLGLIAFLALAVPGTAFAHAQLTSADPAVGATVATAPTHIAINYSEGVEPNFSTVEVQDAAGLQVDNHDLHTAPANNKQLVLGLKPLKPGTYKVTWHATSVDTHKTEGTFNFTLTP